MHLYNSFSPRKWLLKQKEALFMKQICSQQYHGHMKTLYDINVDPVLPQGTTVFGLISHYTEAILCFLLFAQL